MRKKATARRTGRRPDAAVVAVGDELISGRADSNGPAVAGELEAAGLETRIRLVQPDDVRRLAGNLRRLLQEHDVVVLTGGLGPTQDDVTRAAAALALHRSLRFKPAAWRAIQRRLRRMRRRIPDSNRRQAWIPRGAELLANTRGTAPGFFLRAGGRKILAALPGPPRECLPMLRRQLLPRLRRMFATRGPAVYRGQWRCCGLPEAGLQERLGPEFSGADQPELGFLLDEPGEILVILTVRGLPAGEARARLRRGGRRIKRLLGENCVGRAEVSLPAAVGRRLLALRQTLAVAESCSGGLVCRRVTSVPGSSRYFLEGAVAYSNAAKIARLGVAAGLLRRHGAVSPETAEAMAAGIRRASGADWGLAVTGIAGPGGGTRTKPVGTVHLGVSGPGVKRSVSLRLWAEDRETVQRRAAASALDLLRRQLTRRPARA